MASGAIPEILWRRRRELLPLDIPEVPNAAPTEPLTPGFAGGSSPASAIYRQGAALPPDPAQDLPKPSIWRRLLSAGVGAYEGAMRGTPNALPAEVGSQYRQRILYGDYPERMQARRARIDEAARVAELENEAQDRVLRRRYNEAQISNLESLERDRRAGAQARQESEKRLREKEAADLALGRDRQLSTAIRSGAIDQSQIPSFEGSARIPDLPQAAQPKSVRVEAPGYTRFSLPDSSGQTRNLAQPPDLPRGSAYVRDMVEAAGNALPATLEAIDGLGGLGDQQKEMLRLGATSAAKKGNDPSRFLQMAISDINQRRRQGLTPEGLSEVVRKAAATAGAAAAAGSQARLNVGTWQPGSTPEGNMAAWNPATGEARASGDLVRGSGANVSDTTARELSGLLESRRNIGEVDQLLRSGQMRTLGPIIGRIKLSALKAGGGVGIPPEHQRTAIRLAELLTSRAFAQGGKTLTAYEGERFQWSAPTDSDTVEYALSKAQELINGYNRSIQSRWSTLSEPQRQRLSGYRQALGVAGVALPAQPPRLPGGPPAPAPAPSRQQGSPSQPQPSAQPVEVWDVDASGKPIRVR